MHGLVVNLFHVNKIFKTKNGKLFHNFLSRHPQLSVVNSLPVCKGCIKRKRDLANGKKERSLIDCVVVCSCVLPYITEMIINEADKIMTKKLQTIKNYVYSNKF